MSKGHVRSKAPTEPMQGKQYHLLGEATALAEDKVIFNHDEGMKSSGLAMKTSSNSLSSDDGTYITVRNKNGASFR
jgi:hypothetical protein